MDNQAWGVGTPAFMWSMIAIGATVLFVTLLGIGLAVYFCCGQKEAAQTQPNYYGKVRSLFYGSFRTHRSNSRSQVAGTEDLAPKDDEIKSVHPAVVVQETPAEPMKAIAQQSESRSC